MSNRNELRVTLSFSCRPFQKLNLSYYGYKTKPDHLGLLFLRLSTTRLRMKGCAADLCHRLIRSPFRSQA